MAGSRTPGASALVSFPFPRTSLPPSTRSTRAEFEQACEIARKVGAHLRLLSSLSPIQAGASVRLNGQAFDAAMQDLSERMRAFAAQLALIEVQEPMAHAQLEDAIGDAHRVASMLRFMSDASGAPIEAEIEMSAETFASSLGDLADRVGDIERGLDALALNAKAVQ